MPVHGRPQVMLPRLTSVVKKLIIGLLAAYVLQLVLVVWVGIDWVGLLAMRPAGPALWQLLTYLAVDADGPLMFLIGLLFLWWALSPFELAFGSRRTVELCLVVLLSASIPAWLSGFVLVGAPPLYGSAPLWFGGITATTWPQRDRHISLFGVASMTGKQFLLLMVGVAVLIFLASRNYTQFIAILGAMAGAIGYLRWLARRPRAGRVRRPAPRRGFRVIKGGGRGDDERPKYLN